MKKNCIDCAYGGGCFPKYNFAVPCKNEKVQKKEILHDCRPYQNKTEKIMVVENDTAENCEYFIPHIEIEDEDVEVEMIINIYHKCPYCSNEDTEFGEENEGSKIIECSNCGKRYEISWCYEG